MINIYFANRAEQVIQYYNKLPGRVSGYEDPDITDIIDLLTDLRHHCNKYSLDFNSAVSISEMHHQAETMLRGSQK